MLTVTMAHCRASRDRREMLQPVLASWDGKVDMVVCDDRWAGAWRTVRAAWEEALELSGGEGHLFVAQDDFRMARGGVELIEGLCEMHPDKVLSFRWCDETDAWMAPWVASTDQCFVKVSSVWSGGCAAVPVPIVEAFLAWSVEYERVARSVEWHRPEFVTDLLKNRDDTRLDAYLISREIPVLRCRWSLLHHIGDVSEVRMGVRPPSVEINLVEDTSGLPPLTDSRWKADDAPECLAIHEGYRNFVEVVFGRHADRLGLGHARQQHERMI